MARIGILCGLASEARALGRWQRDPRVAVAVSGARTDVAEAKARVLVAEGVRLLVSWGMAGGLAPELSPGSIVVGSAARQEHGPALPLQLPDGRWGRPLLAASRVVATPGEKARLRAETGADAVDMETLATARIADEHGIAALAIRAVADPAHRAVPAFLAGVIDAEGRPQPAALLAGLARQPAAVGALWHLRRDSRMALAALARFAEGELGEIIENAYPGG